MKFLFLVCSFLSLIPPARAQVVLNGGTYSQDFNTLASTGTSSLVPAGWAFLESGANANGTYTAADGTLNAGDTYSFGTGTAIDRAFGSLQSNNLVTILGASFLNSTGSSISALLISYAGEQWRLGTLGRIDQMDFQYSTNATSLSTGTWIDFNSLDFIAPVTTGTVGPLDGNANSTAIGSTITGLNLAPGQTVWIRWLDFNATSADDGLAIDNFSLSVVPEPASYLLFGIGLLACAQRFRRK